MPKRKPVEKLRGVVYSRQSLTREGSESREAQVDVGLDTARRHGVEVVATLVEPESTSAFKDRGRSRPQWAELLRLVSDGQVDVVIVYKTDRVSRGGGPGWAPLLDAAEQAGLDLDRLILTPGGFVSEFELGIRATMDREESKKTSDRMLDMKMRAAEGGRPNGGGRRPFGYTDNKLTALVSDEVTLLHEARRRVVDGESLRSIAIEWNARGLQTTSGAEWTSSNLGRTLRGPHLAGYRVHTVDGKLSKHRPDDGARWPIVFTDAEHEEVVVAAGEHRPAAVTRHLLTGFLVCGACGGSMRSKHSAKVGPRYECYRCNKVTISAQFTEELVSAAVQTVLDSPAGMAALRSATGTADTAALAAELAERQAALAQLARDHYVDRLIPRDAFLAANDDLQAEVRRIEGRMARSAKRITGAPKDVAGYWSDGTIEQRRQVLGVLVERITVAPVGKGAGGPGKAREDRVDIVWKA